jgi:hypothetical protein
VISQSQRPLPTQDNTTNIHFPSSIRTRDPINQVAAALDRAATGIGTDRFTPEKITMALNG